MAKLFNRVFHIVFFAVFSIVTVIAVSSIFGKCIIVNFWGGVAVIALGAAFIVLSVWAFAKLRKRFYDIDDKKLAITFIVMIAVMFTLQLFVGLNAASNPVTDWKVINEVSLSYAHNGSMDNIYENLPYNRDYLARYTNNNGIVVLFSFYYRLIYLISGTVPYEAPIILNTVFITASVVFCFLIAKKAFGNFHALAVAIICFLFLPFYTYCPYFYTDSVSMPFCILSIYLFVCAYESKKILPKIILFFFSGVSCAIGYALKGSIVIVLVAALVYMIYKGGIKKILLGSGTVLAGFLVLSIAFSGLVSSLNIADEETLANQKYPITHWIMMGLNGNGGYNQGDSNITAYAGDYNEKIETNIDIIRKRISDYGFIGLMGHFGKKIQFTWDDGTYYISHHIYDFKDNSNFLHNIIPKPGVTSPVFYAFSSAMHILILVMVCVSAFSCIRKLRLDYITLMHIIMFGAFLFFLIWETRSRYIFNFTPVFIIICADGIITITDRLKKPVTLADKLKKNMPSYKYRNHLLSRIVFPKGKDGMA